MYMIKTRDPKVNVALHVDILSNSGNLTSLNMSRKGHEMLYSNINIVMPTEGVTEFML
jgi:hypothetical protein